MTIAADKPRFELRKEKSGWSHDLGWIPVEYAYDLQELTMWFHTDILPERSAHIEFARETNNKNNYQFKTVRSSRFTNKEYFLIVRTK